MTKTDSESWLPVGVMLAIGAVGFLLWLLSGCSVGIRDKGAYYLEFGTRVEVGAESSQTGGVESTSQIQWNGLENRNGNPLVVPGGSAGGPD